MADDLREQIRRYERALIEVLDHVAPAVRDVVLGRLRMGELTFLDLQNGGKFLPLSQVWKRSVRFDPAFVNFQRNLGRHWLRTHMSGRCSSETLSAFFGHSDLGTEPWVVGSCLDPLMYRADLRRILPDLLRNVGWEPVGADSSAADYLDTVTHSLDAMIDPDIHSGTRGCKRASRSPFHKVVLGHKTAVPNGLDQLKYAFVWQSQQDDKWQLGQILASAIVNGALLDRAFWDSWLEQIPFSKKWDDRIWVTMTHQVPRTGRIITKRWFADPVTAKLIEAWREKRKVNGVVATPQQDANSVLSHFLDLRCDRVSIDTFHSWAEWRWRLRLPPLLLNHALGATPSVTMSEDDWSQFVGKKRTLRWVFHSSKSRHAGAKKNQERWNADFKRNYPVKSRIFTFSGHLRRTGGITSAMEKRLCAEGMLSKPTYVSQGHTLLDLWCAHRLTQNRGNAFSQGYAPSTVRYRLAAILECLFPGNAGNGEFRIDKETLKSAMLDAYDRYQDVPTRKELRKASQDLAGYLSEMDGGAPSSGGADSLLESLGRLDSDTTDLPDAVSANLISEEKFQDLIIACGSSNVTRRFSL